MQFKEKWQHLLNNIAIEECLLKQRCGDGFFINLFKRCGDGVINDFLFRYRYLLVPLRFHGVTYLHPPSFQRNDFSPCSTYQIRGY